MPKLTKTMVDSLRPKARRYTITDSTITGFEIRVNTNGTKTAAVLYRRGGRLRRVTLGKLHDGYTFTQAREDAVNILREVKGGRDPAGERAQHRQAPTVADLAQRYMTEHVRLRCKPKTIELYEILLRLYVVPELGTLKVHEVTTADVDRMHRKIGQRAKGSANASLSLVSALMGRAELWGLRSRRSNPVFGIKRFAEKKHERFLSAEERARVEEILTKGERTKTCARGYIAKGHAAAIRLLLATGARKNEIGGLKWSMVDLDAGCLRLPDSKTGAKTIYLSPHAIRLLTDLKASNTMDSQWVCHGIHGQRLRNLDRTWTTIRRRAGLDDVRLHDLRHSFASDSIAAGLPLAMVGKLLGHESHRTTARYAHLADHDIRSAARVAGERIEKQTKAGAAKLRDKKDE